MIIELDNTSSREISAELTKARRGAGASGLVLTLIIATTHEHFDAVVAAARASATAHPSRVIVVTTVDDDEARLDARIQVGDGLPGDLVVLRLHGLLHEHADSILLPLLLPDSPTVVWWPNEGPQDLAADPIGQLADRRITDASECKDPQDALLNRARHHADGDTDLTWTRITRWRALLVAAAEQLQAPIIGAKVVSAPDNAPATLLAAWLSLKLGVDVERTDGDSAGVNEVQLQTESGDVVIRRPGDGTAYFSAPGQPPRKVALRRRPLTDLLTEELERMDTDEVFEETLEHLLKQQELALMYTRVVRLPSAQDVAELVAERLVDTIVALQGDQGDVHICLTGGQTANTMYEVFADLAATSDIDATRLHFWWGDERFVPATDPDRNSLQAIERLARTIPIHSAHIHMMAARDGRKDSHESASVYESELGDTEFDVTLMGLGEDGHCASIFQDHPSFEPTNRLVIGVEDSPKPPPERITLTFNAINRSTDVWFLATGDAKANALAAVLDGDETLPATHVRGRKGTVWFVDEQAASALPAQFRCEL